MALPEHKYYTLKQAAVKASCGIDDLIHFAAIGVLQLCVKIPLGGFYKIEDDAHTGINISVEYTFDAGKLTDDNRESQSDGAIICSYESDYFSNVDCIKLVEDEIDSVSGLNVFGFLGVNSEDIYDVEHGLIEEDDFIYTCHFSIPRASNAKHDPYYSVYGAYTSELLEIERDSLLITNYEMSLLLEGGKELDTPDQSDDSRSAKARGRENASKPRTALIYQLIQLAFIEDGGITKLSNESIAEQIQVKLRKAGIPHDDISPYNIRNWIGGFKEK
ncbi:hypothetical protein JBO46_12925 [Serratia fonticola]|nr:hypothetical protein [Serratia fonticola]